jgi:hypothetical protein
MLSGRRRPESGFAREVLRDDTSDETSDLRGNYFCTHRAFGVALHLEVARRVQCLSPYVAQAARCVRDSEMGFPRTTGPKTTVRHIFSRAVHDN